MQHSDASEKLFSHSSVTIRAEMSSVPLILYQPHTPITPGNFGTFTRKVFLRFFFSKEKEKPHKIFAFYLVTKKVLKAKLLTSKLILPDSFIPICSRIVLINWVS